MKLAPRDWPAFLKRPDVSKAGLLLYGPDAMRIADRRKALVEALVGPQGAEEMRFERMAASELRSDAARLADALKAQGFFPGQRAVLVEDATDSLAKSIAPALEDWREGDAFLLVTAGQLAARSTLRKLFEGAGNAYALAIYADPPGREEIEAMMEKAGVAAAGDAMAALTAMGRTLEPGDFAQLLEKLALYKRGDNEPLTVAEIEALAPQTADDNVDALVAAVADGMVPRIGLAMSRLEAQGANPTTICIGTTRHFRQLHAAAGAGGRAEEALQRLRPPVFGPRRDAMAAQVRAWGLPRLERALMALTETDLALRGGSGAPAMPLLERALIRVAMMRPRT